MQQAPTKSWLHDIRDRIASVLMAQDLRPKAAMNLICEHCDEMIVGNAYRVTSEEDGIILLDMIVCSLCGMEAKRLQLHTEVLDSAAADAAGGFRRDQRSRMRL